MPEFGYSMDVPAGKDSKFARAQVYGIDASWKDLGAVCANLVGLTAEEADALLVKAGRGEFPIRFRKHNKKMGHRGELGGKKGRYPEKCARIALKVLRNAVANANARGLFGELVVVQSSANKQGSFPRVAPRGRWRRANYETARMEIVLKEAAEAKPDVKAKRKKEFEARAERKRKAREEAEKALEKELAAHEGHAHAHEGEGAEEKKLTPEEKEAEKALERAQMSQGQG
ncbi:MAG: uL22 family ribosomal protein [Candidatus ainarchaeum sp.]|nr:uL22 family ribosomal protein [Candidatus ainarchaeum sp.]